MPAFHRALAMEFVADGIRANTISPGVVDTPMHAKDDHEILKKLMPIPRLVKISEIVGALLYLESAPMVNGCQVIRTFLDDCYKPIRYMSNKAQK
jgi:NAD(P)-dependent dehydrogenase (short-subunit alcohol dehydrogenase family)